MRAQPGELSCVRCKHRAFSSSRHPKAKHTKCPINTLSLRAALRTFLQRIGVITWSVKINSGQREPPATALKTRRSGHIYIKGAGKGGWIFFLDEHRRLTTVVLYLSILLYAAPSEYARASLVERSNLTASSRYSGYMGALLWPEKKTTGQDSRE